MERLKAAQECLEETTMALRAKKNLEASLSKKVSECNDELKEVGQEIATAEADAENAINRFAIGDIPEKDLTAARNALATKRERLKEIESLQAMLGPAIKKAQEEKSFMQKRQIRDREMFFSHVIRIETQKAVEAAGHHVERIIACYPHTNNIGSLEPGKLGKLLSEAFSPLGCYPERLDAALSAAKDEYKFPGY